MKVYCFLLIAVLAMAPAFQASQAPQKEPPASIHGVVVNAITKEPVEGAVVELTWVERNRVRNTYVVTGPQGRFDFDDLQPAKDYQLVASDTSNFVAAAFGQRSPADPWSPIELAAGQNLRDVRIMVSPLSTIRGKVVDGASKPLEHAQVYLLRAAYAKGRRVLEQASYPQATNAKGDYFFSGLGAGQYYVRVTPPNETDRLLFDNPSRWVASRNSGEPQGYPSSYFPGTMDITAAQPVNLLSAEKVQGINIVIKKVQTRRVSGTVLLESRTGSLPEPAERARVFLVPRSAGPESSLTRSTTAVSGQFDFRGVLPGNYYLLATMSDGKTSLTGRQPLDVLDNVRDADLKKLSITVIHGFDIPGRIHFAEGPQEAPADYSQLAINLVPDVFTPTDQSIVQSQIQVTSLTLVPAANGEFTLKNIAPNDFRLVISLNPKLAPDAKLPLYLKTAYMASANLGDTEVLNGGIHINSKPNGTLDLVLGTDTGTVSGRVLEDNHAADLPVRMVIVPALALRKRFDLFSPIEVSATGLFSLSGIPPGDYKIFAWSQVEIGAWFDPEFMKVYEDRGVPVHIEAADSSSVDVTLIR